MADSTTHIDGIVQGQAGQDLTANAAFDAGSPAFTYGRRDSTTSGTTWGYYGGNVLVKLTASSFYLPLGRVKRVLDRFVEPA